MYVTRHWDIISMVFYIVIACVITVCFSSGKLSERKIGHKVRVTSFYYIFCWLLMTIVAASRLVNSNGVGGTDAYAYAVSFESIVGSSTSYSIERLNHYGVAWTIICNIISNISGNYHVFFFIMYGFIAFAYIMFFNEFAMTDISYSPFILVMFLYVISFNTLRTAVTVAIILICMVLMKRKKPVLCIPLGLLSIAIQSSSVIYVMYIPFYYINRKYKISLKKGTIIAVLSYAVGLVVRYLFSTGIISVKYYSNYAERSYYTSFFDNYWKIVFGQLLLLGAILVMRKWLSEDTQNRTAEDKERYDFIWQMCIFDLVLIPFCYLIWLWRAWQYFYMARLIMWGELCRVGDTMMSYSSKKLYRFIVFCLFVAWLTFMVYSYCERSGLTPYIFSPFHSLS